MSVVRLGKKTHGYKECVKQYPGDNIHPRKCEEFRFIMPHWDIEGDRREYTRNEGKAETET